MASLALNKGVLKRERDRLQRFQRFLPSLDLKRKQLVAELNRARKALDSRRDEIERFLAGQKSVMSLLGASGLDLSGLVRVRAVDMGEENVLGVKLPVVQGVDIRVAEYSTLAMPFWVDALAEAVRAVAILRISRQVEAERVRLLERAVRRVTQRVNLFEKVLIPTARRNIKRISVYLADAERAAVVRSKIAKARNEQGPRR
jgi:V/A-type H+-transporting ATPase subunit D